MMNYFIGLNINLKNIIYSFDDNIVNKNKFHKVIEELNKKRIIEFIKYNLFDDNRKIKSYENKRSRLYLMDLLSNDDFFKYTDYEDQRVWWTHTDLITTTTSKYEIVKNFKNHKELYNILLNEYLNTDNEQLLYDIIMDFNDWINEHNYFDKRVIKNDIFQNWESSTDTDESVYVESEISEWFLMDDDEIESEDSGVET
jgi:hypothetical protein